MENKDLSPKNKHWLCPLYSFDCYADAIDLADSIQIKRITPEFRNYLEERHPDWEEALGAEHMIVLSHSGAVEEEEAGYFAEVIDKSSLLVDLVTAFRLCHSGSLIPGPLIPSGIKKTGVRVFTRRGISQVFGEIMLDIGKIDFDFTSVAMLAEYEFRAPDAPTVKKLMMQIRACRESRGFTALDEVLRRFNSSYHGEPEDRLIDQMIAFESLYIGDDKELGYKLALRAAFLLGRGRAKIFSNMKKAYALRGQIVHGNKPVAHSELEQIIPLTEEYLRQSIRRFLLLLSQGYSPKRIREHLLDENILKNGKPLALRE